MHPSLVTKLLEIFSTGQTPSSCRSNDVKGMKALITCNVKANKYTTEISQQLVGTNVHKNTLRIILETILSGQSLALVLKTKPEQQPKHANWNINLYERSQTGPSINTRNMLKN